MPNQLTERFKQCVEHLKEIEAFPSLRKFSNSIGVHPQCISDIYTGKREVNSDIILKAYQNFEVNPNYIYTGEGHFLLKECPGEPIQEETDSKKIKCVLTTFHSNYIQSVTNPKFDAEVPCIRLLDDKFCQGEMCAFEMPDDRMEPALMPSDILVANKLETSNNLKLIKKFVYVFVTTDGILVRRVKDYDPSSNSVATSNDNAFYENEMIPLDQILELWQVRTIIKPFRPAQDVAYNGISQEVDNLRNTISDQGKMIYSLNATIEKLLKQNRRSSSR